MKKINEILCITIVAIILSGCAQSTQSEENMYVEDTTQTGENGEMIDFFDWEHSNKGLGLGLDLTEKYHLEMKPLEDPENYYCIFYIKDVNGNVSYSEMIPIQQ